MTSNIQKAVEILHQGGIVAFPTETVYGIGCDAKNTSAINKIYEIKNRSSSKPLTLHFASFDDAKKYAESYKISEQLANKFLPGALTLIMESKSVSEFASQFAELNTVGVRIPSHKTAQDLLRTFGSPIAGTSANISGDKPLVSAEEIISIFGNQIDMVLKCSECIPTGTASTILDITKNPTVIIRKGDLINDIVDYI